MGSTPTTGTTSEWTTLHSKSPAVWLRFSHTAPSFLLFPTKLCCANFRRGPTLRAQKGDRTSISARKLMKKSVKSFGLALFCTIRINHARFYSHRAKNDLCLGLISMLTNSSPLIVRLKLRLAPYKFLRFVSFLAAFLLHTLTLHKIRLLWHTIRE